MSRLRPALCIVSLCLALAACGDRTPAAGDPVAAPATSAATPAETPSGDVSGAPVTTEGQVYDCGGRPLTARFDAGAGTATVMFDGTSLTMRQAVAASGAKYTDEAGNTFWTRGSSEATLTLSGAPDIACSAPASAG